MTTEALQRPFWVEDAWKESKLPDIAGGKTAKDVATAVPQFVLVETEHLIGEYAKKDGLLLYHIFHRQRKEIFDHAEAEMVKIRESTKNPQQVYTLQQEVANRANSELEKHPWWSNFEQLIKAAFSEHFRYHPFKVNYYQEVDSWSVAMPEPKPPLPLTPERLAAPLHTLEAALSTKS